MRLWKPIVLALLLGACAVVDAARPKLDDAYDKALAAWCVLPPATHLRAIGRGAIEARSLTDNCPAGRAIRGALIGDAMQRLGLEAMP